MEFLLSLFGKAAYDPSVRLSISRVLAQSHDVTEYGIPSSPYPDSQVLFAPGHRETERQAAKGLAWVRGSDVTNQ